jgi:putative MATE family efflux protein
VTDKEYSPQEAAVFKRDWTKGPILSNLLLISWPMVVMELLYMVSQIVDMIWVGRLGSVAIAGVGVANIVIMIVMAMDFGLIMGLRAMVARFIGAGDTRGASNVAGQAILLSVAWGILITVAGIFLAEPVMRCFGVEAAVVAEGAAYMRVMFAGWVTMELLIMCLFSVQSSGDTITPMVLEACIRAVHVAICPVLVLGWWVFPSLGVRGAALSNIIAHSLGTIVLFIILFKGYSRLRLVLSDFRPVPDILWRILKIGIPALVMNLQKALGDVVLTWLIVPFGTVAVAAHSLNCRLEMFVMAVALGIGGGAGVLVGQNLGAAQPEKAKKSGWFAVGVLEVFMVAFGVAILLWAEPIIGMFTTEPELVEVGSVFLRIAVAGYLMMAIVFVFQSSIAGAGDTMAAMIVSIGMIWVVMLPMAFFLPGVVGLGVLGVRWAIVAGGFAGALAFVVYFAMGRWKGKKV